MTASRRSLLTGASALLGACQARAPVLRRRGVLHPERLQGGIAGLAAHAAPGTFGAGVMIARNQQSWFFSAGQRFPLASAFMLPMAAAALAEVDAGRMRLDDRIKISEFDLSAPPSAINERWPTPPEHHAAAVPAIDLIALAIQRSDNTAADVILRTIGGPGAVTAWLEAKGLLGMRVDRYERELQQECAGLAPFRPEWKDEAAWTAARESIPPEGREAAMTQFLADPRDTTTPEAAALFLYKLIGGALLSARSTGLLLRLMRAPAGDAGALAQGLPAGSSLAHKWGATRTDVGLTPADNDLGVATLADGTRIILVSLQAGSTATAPARARLAADFAALAVRAIE